MLSFLQALLTAEDAVISDQLNHASIIDGIRLCKAQRFRCVPSLTAGQNLAARPAVLRKTK